jgi:hypothetical protein
MSPRRGGGVYTKMIRAPEPLAGFGKRLALAPYRPLEGVQVNTISPLFAANRPVL